jgi:FAD/FMN-containing dehydrogenase
VATTTERFLAEHPAGCVVRTATPLRDMAAALDRLPGTLVARAGNGVIYTHLEDAAQAADVLRLRHSLIEYGPAVATPNLTYWPETDSSFPIMQRIKKMFDPNCLLNRGRLYGRI